MQSPEFLNSFYKAMASFLPPCDLQSLETTAFDFCGGTQLVC